MLKFADAINRVTVSICLAAVGLCLFYWACGGFATTVGYTIKKDFVAGTSAPSPNVYYDVVEVRDSGRDRYIYSTFNIDDALRVLKEIQTIKE